MENQNLNYEKIAQNLRKISKNINIRLRKIKNSNYYPSNKSKDSEHPNSKTIIFSIHKLKPKYLSSINYKKTKNSSISYSTQQKNSTDEFSFDTSNFPTHQISTNTNNTNIISNRNKFINKYLDYYTFNKSNFTSHSNNKQNNLHEKLIIKQNEDFIRMFGYLKPYRLKFYNYSYLQPQIPSVKGIINKFKYHNKCVSSSRRILPKKKDKLIYQIKIEKSNANKSNFYNSIATYIRNRKNKNLNNSCENIKLSKIYNNLPKFKDVFFNKKY
jgi:hypothetical protein